MKTFLCLNEKSVSRQRIFFINFVLLIFKQILTSREEAHKLEEKLREMKILKQNDIEKKNMKNCYKWLLKKEDAKFKTGKTNDYEKIKAELIVCFYLNLN